MPVMNSPRLIAEVRAALVALRDCGETRTFYFAGKALEDDDALYLAEYLGEGCTVIEMRGLARTVWRESSYPGVWWGEYYADGHTTPSLRTIEVAEVPVLVRATPEDIAEAVRRMEANPVAEIAQAASSNHA
jgi:hypothetical protein